MRVECNAASAVTADPRHLDQASLMQQVEENPNNLSLLLRWIEGARVRKDWNGELTGYRKLYDFFPLSDQEWRRYIDLARKCQVGVKHEFDSTPPGTIPAWVFRHFGPDGMLLQEETPLDENDPLSVLEGRLVGGEKFESLASEYMLALRDTVSSDSHLQIQLLLRKMMLEDTVRVATAWRGLFVNCRNAHRSLLAPLAKVSLKACRDSTWVRRNYLCLVGGHHPLYEDLKRLEGEILMHFDPEHFEDVMQLFLDLAAIARRNLWEGRKVEEARQYWRELIQLAGHIGTGDLNHMIRRYWIRLEYGGGDAALGRQMMDALLGEATRQSQSDPRLWLEAAWLEIGIKEPRRARSIFRKAVESVTPANVGRILVEYERFLQEWGDFEDFYEFWTLTKASKEPLESPKTVKPHLDRELNETRKRPKIADSTPPSNDGVGEREPFDPSRTLFLSNLPFKAREEDILKFFVKEHSLSAPLEAILTLDKNGKSRGLAHLVLSSPEEMQTAVRLDRSIFMGRPMFITRYQPVPRAQRERIEYPTGRDPKTLYLSRLSSDTTHSDLEQAFTSSPGLLAIRLIINKAGHFKGSAYVQFESEEAALDALHAQDGQVVRGSRIKVQISDPEAAKIASQALKMTPRNVTPVTHAKSRLAIDQATPAAMEPEPLAKTGQEHDKDNEDFRKLFIKD